MVALVRVDRERRYFNSTTSSTLLRSPCNRVRWRQLEDGPARLELSLPRPKVCETYYSACSMIDLHDRCRQDDLMMERKIETKDWSFRGNTTLLSMCIVDSWLLYSGVQEGHQGAMTQREFYTTLATELIDNCYDIPHTRHHHVSSMSPVRFHSVSSGVGVHLTPTKRKRKTGGGQMTNFRLQNNCVICKVMKTSMICSECRTRENRQIWLCSSITRRDCFARHISDEHRVKHSLLN